MKTNLLSSGLETYTPRILAVGVLLVILLLALTGCKNASKTHAGVNPVGIYTLISVEGKSVPCHLTHEGAAMAIKSGRFTINADGTCLSLCTFAVPPHPDDNREVKATYTQEDSNLTLRWQGAGITTGHIQGNEFTMNNEGMIFVYCQ